MGAFKSNINIYDLSFIDFDIDKLQEAYEEALEIIGFTDGAVTGISLTKIPNSSISDMRGIYWIKNEDYIEEQRESPVNEFLYTQFEPSLENTYFKEIYNRLSAHFVLGRVRILKLDPRKTLSFHRDPEVRLHIPIVTNPGALMIVDNFATHMPANGSVYYMNTEKYHLALNGGESSRVHLVATILDVKNVLI